MAQSLENRMKSALRARARLTDVDDVISEVKREIHRTQEFFDTEAARSIDPALTTPEARQARNNAADLEHDLRRLGASLTLLKERRQKIIDDDTRDRKLARYNAAKEKRDELARHIRQRYPVLAMELADMAHRISENEAECEAVSEDRPSGVEALKNAEYLARECGWCWPGIGSTPVHRISRITLPLLSRHGNYLPLEERTAGGEQERQAAGIKADQEFAKKPIAGIDQLASFSAQEAVNA